MKNRGASFQQSLYDFPCSVELGSKVPSWGISRWNKSGLRFVPSDDEGFTMRGDKRRLVYNGRRRSHRFTILGNNAFEYDCILLREPESNVVSLLMEGVEKFDFFRQPDFVPDPSLKGSYAVYKKETLLGEGTGKLCHIHRPEIIDAKGRRCWGELAVVGNELRIAIPKRWLSEAAYPVIIDPTIGTSTIGSQTQYVNEDGDRIQLFLEFSIGVNRFLMPETLNGNATAYVYAYETDYEGRCKPVIYSDNNNVPLTRRSSSEGEFDIAVRSGKPAGWRSTTFNTNTIIVSGTNIWFGLFCDWFAPRFDYGQKCYWDFWDGVGNDIPNTYPVWKTNWFYDFKISMYFTYTSAQNYVRTITHGVNLSDSRKLAAEYKRNATEQVQANMIIAEFLIICRKIHEAVQGFDNNSFPVFYIRSLNETATVKESLSRWWNIFRGLIDIAENESEVKGGFAYFSKIADTVHAAGSMFRGLTIFVRIITTSFVRDYLLRRFLVAREELVLKSCITRDITLNSKI